LASLLIRNLDDALHELLKARARDKNRSLAEEARETLRDAIAREAADAEPENIYQIARQIFGEKNGVDLDIPPRTADLERAPPDFSGPEYDP